MVHTRPPWSSHYKSLYQVALHLTDIQSTQGFMLIDLTDTTNWPHTETGHIELFKIHSTICISKDADIDLVIGFLSNVDASNGDLNHIFEWNLDEVGTNERTVIFDDIDFHEYPIPLTTGTWFGTTSANRSEYQTDVNLLGPDGNASYPSGDGDMVVLVGRDAGRIQACINVFYTTVA